MVWMPASMLSTCGGRRTGVREEADDRATVATIVGNARQRVVREWRQAQDSSKLYGESVVRGQVATGTKHTTTSVSCPTQRRPETRNSTTRLSKDASRCSNPKYVSRRESWPLAAGSWQLAKVVDVLWK
jgi:hypothetical protein